MARRCKPSWLDAYLEYTKCSEAPETYHLWVGLTTLSSVLRRRVWKDRGFHVLFPNLYTFLVGPSGTRKSSAIKIGKRLLQGGMSVQTAWGLRQAQPIPNPPHIVDSFRTPELFVSELVAVCSQNNPPLTPFIIMADEAPSFFRRAKYAVDMIPILIKFYDGDTESPGTQLRGIEKVESPYATMLCGVIPEILVDIMPKEATAGGFASRVIWVYSEDTTRCFAHPELEDGYKPELYIDLVHDLAIISQLKGEMTLTKGAYEYFDKWYSGVRHEVADTVDGRYMGYMNRKGDMVYKVAMLLSMSESDKLEVREKHFLLARTMIETLEPDLSKVYAGTGGRQPILDKRDIVFKILKQVHPGWISRSELTKKCYNNRISAAELDEALNQLMQEKVLEWKPVGKGIHYRIKSGP